MTSRLRTVIAGASALAVTGAILVAGAATASASVTPGWTPDANTIGGVYFYDASGHQITSGSLSASPMAAYYVGSGSDTAGAKAFVATSTPVAGQNSATWAGTQQYTSSQTQPLSGLPGDLAGSTQTILAGAAGDGSFTAQQITPFQNTSTTAGYQNLYEVRIYKSASASTWFSAVIQVDTTAGTWTQVWPAQTATTTVLATSASTVVNPGSATLTATVSPASAGNVVFSEGATVIATVAVSSGTAATTVNYTSTGSHTYSARFVPTPGTANLGSTSGNVSVNVIPPADATNTALSVTPASGAGFSSQTLTAVVTDTSVPATTPVGTVAFYDNGSSTALAGTVTQSPAGTFTLVTTALGQGAHSIVAKFTPTNSALFNASQSAATGFTLTQPLCADGTTNCLDTQNITATVVPGGLTLTTPYTAGHPFNVGNLTVNGTGTLITGSATFPAATDNPLTITDTRSGNVGWAATVYDSPLTSTAVAGPGQYNSINGENVGLTNWSVNVPAGNAFPASQIVTHDLAAANGVAPSDTSGGGIWGGGTPATASTFATNSHGDGTAWLRATLTIQAPTSTVAGTYDGTITFTVA